MGWQQTGGTSNGEDHLQAHRCCGRKREGQGVTSGFFDGARFSWSAFRAYFCATFNDLCRASAATASIAMPASDAAVYMPTRPL